MRYLVAVGLDRVGRTGREGDLLRHGLLRRLGLELRRSTPSASA